MKKYIGIDLGGMSAKGSILYNGLLGEICTCPTGKEVTAQHTVDDLADLVGNIFTRAAIKKSEIAGVGIGSPGIVDSANGVVVRWENFGWKDVPLARMLQERIGLPMTVLNDANAATLGEYGYGAAKKYNSAVMLTLGTGVGSGIVINGKIFTGNKGAGGEIGHEVIRIGGEKCTCGRRGCLERYASTAALIRQAKVVMGRNPKSVLWQLCDGKSELLNGKMLFEATRQNDVTAKRVLKKYIAYVAEGVVNAINAFRPQAVIIGGGISVQEELLIQPLRKQVNKYVGEFAPVEVVGAKLGNAAGIYGAAMFAEKGETI